MRWRIRDLYRKLRWQAVIPWDCIIAGHRMRLHPAAYSDPLLERNGQGRAWSYCTRPGCTREAILPRKKMI